MDHFRSHSHAGNSDKCSESVAGKKKRKEVSAGRKRGGRGCGGQMGHAEGADFQVGPAGYVWTNRKWQGAFEGPWHWTLKPGCCAPSSASEPRHSSHSPWSSSRGTSARALCEASVGTSRQCSTSEVSQLSAIPCRSGAGSRASPGAPAERADRLCPFVPGLPRHLHDCIDLSRFHSARGPAGFQVSNICHTEVASCWAIKSGDKSAQNCLWICNKKCMDFFFFYKTCIGFMIDTRWQLIKILTKSQQGQVQFLNQMSLKRKIKCITTYHYEWCIVVL